VYIYKIGKEWGDKKSICNKFPTSSSVTSMTWPHERSGEVIFGLAEGKVRAGVLRSNKVCNYFKNLSILKLLCSLKLSTQRRAML